MLVLALAAVPGPAATQTALAVAAVEVARVGGSDSRSRTAAPVANVPGNSPFAATTGELTGPAGTLFTGVSGAATREEARVIRLRNKGRIAGTRRPMAARTAGSWMRPL